MSDAQVDGAGAEVRLDELARRAGVASTTVRLYQSKGLLHPPRLQGRVGWYDDTHLARLRLIARLQQDGHSLAGILDLLTQWERGRSLDAVIGVEAQLDALVSDIHAIEVDPVELVRRFPAGAMNPALMQRAAALGLITPGSDGRVRIPDPRFVETGAALAHLGVPLDVVLDEWEALTAFTDTIAERFVNLFDERFAPSGGRAGLDDEQASELAATLAQLQAIARHVVAAALDTSLTRIGRQRLGRLIDARGTVTATGWTRAQRTRPGPKPSFSPRVLLLGAPVATSVGTLPWLGYSGVVLIRFVATPLAASLLVLAWVQPRRSALIAAAPLSVALDLLLALLFIGAAERALDSVVFSAVLMAFVTLPLWQIRQRTRESGVQRGQRDVSGSDLVGR